MLWRRCSNVEATSWQRWTATLSQRRKLTSVQLSFSTVPLRCDNVVTTSLCQLGSNEYNIRNFQVLSDFRRTVNYGIETITYRELSLLAKLPSDYKLAASLEAFKVKIKKWKCDACPCRLCKKISTKSWVY